MIKNNYILSETDSALIVAVSNSGSDTPSGSRPSRLTGGDYTLYPFATIQAASDSLPPIRLHDCIIKLLSATNYAGVSGGGFSGYGRTRITGASALQLASITGVNSGTAASGTSSTTLNIPSGTWTANALRQNFLVIDSGGGNSGDINNPTIRPIKSNTTTQLTVDAIVGMDNTSIFRIVTVGATINKAATPLVSGATQCIAFSDCSSPIEIIAVHPTDSLLTHGLYALRCNKITAYGLQLDTLASQTVWLTECGTGAVYDSVIKNTANVLVDQGRIGHVDRCLVDNGQITLDELNGAYSQSDALTCSSTVLTVSNSQKGFITLNANSCTSTIFVHQGVTNLTIGGFTGTNASVTYVADFSHGGCAYMSGATMTGLAGAGAFVVDGFASSWTELGGAQAGIVDGGTTRIINAANYVLMKSRFQVWTNPNNSGDGAIFNDIIQGGQQKSYGQIYSLKGDGSGMEVVAVDGGQAGALTSSAFVGVGLRTVISSAAADDYNVIIKDVFVTGGAGGVIHNDSGHRINLWPPSGKALNSLTNNTAISLPDQSITEWASRNTSLSAGTILKYKVHQVFQGPASATDKTIPRYNGTSGEAVQTSNVVISDADELSGYNGNLNAQTTTTYTLVTTDTGKVLTLNNGSAVTVTLPNNLVQGFNCTAVQKGAGQVTFSPASGASLNNFSSQTKTGGQWAVCGLYVDSNSSGTAAVYVLGGTTGA